MSNKTRVIQIRLTEEDYKVIKNAYKCNLSNYIREILLKNVDEYAPVEETNEIREFEKFRAYLQKDEVAKDLFENYKNQNK